MCVTTINVLWNSLKINASFNMHDVLLNYFRGFVDVEMLLFYVFWDNVFLKVKLRFLKWIQEMDTRKISF